MYSLKKVIENLKQKNITIASIESFTGGLFASMIVNYPGVSSFFKGSLVSYNNSIKEKLGVDTSKGVVNKEVALEMSQKGKEFFDVDYCISFTGNAGPGVLDGKEVGLIYIAINNSVFELKFNSTSRNNIRKKAVKFALIKLNDLIN